MRIPPYLHKAQYYETDKMGVIHHSNYIRWMEEARVDAMDQAGYSYQRLETEGFMMPQLLAHCEYKTAVRFGDTVRIHCYVIECTGVKLTIGYRIEDALTGELRATGETKHCFVNRQGYPINIKKNVPDFYCLLNKIMQEGNR